VLYKIYGFLALIDAPFAKPTTFQTLLQVSLLALLYRFPNNLIP